MVLVGPLGLEIVVLNHRPAYAMVRYGLLYVLQLMLELNSGACTPMITRPSSAYFECQILRWGKVRIQLMQV